MAHLADLKSAQNIKCCALTLSWPWHDFNLMLSIDEVRLDLWALKCRLARLATTLSLGDNPREPFALFIPPPPQSMALGRNNSRCHCLVGEIKQIKPVFIFAILHSHLSLHQRSWSNSHTASPWSKQSKHPPSIHNYFVVVTPLVIKQSLICHNQLHTQFPIPNCRYSLSRSPWPEWILWRCSSCPGRARPGTARRGPWCSSTYIVGDVIPNVTARRSGKLRS